MRVDDFFLIKRMGGEVPHHHTYAECRSEILTVSGPPIILKATKLA